MLKDTKLSFVGYSIIELEGEELFGLRMPNLPINALLDDLLCFLYSS
jgi:hypothetical protein